MFGQLAGRSAPSCRAAARRGAACCAAVARVAKGGLPDAGSGRHLPVLPSAAASSGSVSSSGANTPAGAPAASHPPSALSSSAQTPLPLASNILSLVPGFAPQKAATAQRPGTAPSTSVSAVAAVVTSVQPPLALPDVRPRPTPRIELGGLDLSDLVDPTTTQPSTSGRGPQHHEHPTLRLLGQRLRQGTRPGGRRDQYKLGLVVEGGGMRGIISGAMLMALQELGLVNCFDAVYGASAGAINSTYFLSGQKHGLQIYPEDLTRGNSFIDYSNIFARNGRPVMNLDYLIDFVMHEVKPLDWAAVLNSPVPLKIVASCLDSLQPIILQDFDSQRELVECLKASATVPHFAGPPRHIRGRQLVDAAVFEPVPVASAIKDGCTHVLVLCTRPPPTADSPWMKRVKGTLEAVAKNVLLNPPYMRAAWNAQMPGACSEEQLVWALHNCPFEVQAAMGSFVLPIYPESTAGCHPLTLCPDTLRRGIDVGHRAAVRMVGPAVGRSAPAPSGVGSGQQAYGVPGLYSPGMELQFRP